MASDVPEDVTVNIPVACSLSAAELRVRGAENTSLFARATGVQELPDGYAFTFPAEDERARDLLAFVLAERACCPFFTFELAFVSPHASIRLTMRGREGVKEIVHAAAVSKVHIDGGRFLAPGCDVASGQACGGPRRHALITWWRWGRARLGLSLFRAAMRAAHVLEGHA
jgi:hypothetical protein